MSRDIIFDPQMTSYDMASLEALMEDMRPGLAIEIGSWKGLSTSIIARYAGLLYCVDTWQGAPDEVDMVVEAAERSVFNIFMNNLAALNLTHKVKPLYMSSLEAQQIFRPGILDFIYIDADHSYDAVMEDLTWFELLKVGGTLAGHDFDDKHQGVVRAVKESFGDRVTVMEKSSIWYIQKVE